MALSVLRTKATSDGGGSAKKKLTPADVAGMFDGVEALNIQPVWTRPAAAATTPSKPTTPAKTTTTNKTTTTPGKQTSTTKTTTPAVAAPTITTPTLNLPDAYQMPDLGSYGERPTYQQSAAVQAAYNTYQQYLASKPGAFQSNYQGQIDSLLGEIMNRPAFSYDFNADPMYQMYRDNYMEQGRQAMMDTMANAAALTGGYGNSYAATAGQQAYQGHLQQLNNVIPELWQMAYNVYLDEGDAMRSNMSLLQALDNTDYSRYRDTVSDWQTDRSFAWNAYNTEYDRDYGMYRDTVGDWESDRAFQYAANVDLLNQSNRDREFAYQQYMDELNQSNYAQEFAYQQAQDALAQQNYEREWEYQVAQDALARASRSGGGSSSSGGRSAIEGEYYGDVEKVLKGMDGAEAQEYLNNAVASGLISGDEAAVLGVIYNVGTSGAGDALTFGGASSGGGGMIGDKSTDDLEELALNMWAGAGSGRNPYQILENNSSLTAAQKEYVRNALDDLNDNDVNVGYYRG